MQRESSAKNGGVELLKIYKKLPKEKKRTLVMIARNL